MAHPAGGHLRSPGVVDAQEQDRWVEVRPVGLEPDERAQAVVRQPLDEDRHVRPDLRVRQDEIE
jgi:hypothetical protein